MKKILVWISALLAWQFLVMKKKDNNFKTQLSKKQWREKVEYVFNRLIQFNKELLLSAKQSVQEVNQETIQEKAEETKERIEEEYKKIKKYLTENKVLPKKSDNTIETFKNEMEDRLKTFEKKAKSLGDDLDKQINRKAKLAELKKLYENIQKKI